MMTDVAEVNPDVTGSDIKSTRKPVNIQKVNLYNVFREGNDYLIRISNRSNSAKPQKIPKILDTINSSRRDAW